MEKNPQLIIEERLKQHDDSSTHHYVNNPLQPIIPYHSGYHHIDESINERNNY